MRLINIKTLKLEEFPDGKIPPYAILSHTWGNDWEELTLVNIENGEVDKPGIGPVKFRGCCQEADRDGLGYVWIDTCCIDKTNLVELSEAINSMFRWYSCAHVCYVYLSDVPDDDDARGSKFQTSRWFQRGWTLQELLAPKNLRFFNAEWRCIGTKRSKCTIIKNITQVPRQFLLGITELNSASVAQRMSWAAQRETKRAEDLAYCLLGIFDITMPMIYGEGGKQAFFRLQEQIMRTTRDDSILAWDLSTEEEDGPSVGSFDQIIGGEILAPAPSYFANSGQIITQEQSINPLHSLDIFGGETFGLLSCRPGHDNQQVVGIPLAKMASGVSNEYVRPRGRPSMLRPIAESDALPELIHIKKDGQKDTSAKTNQQHLLYEDDLFAEVDLTLIEAFPPSCWDKQMALISSGDNSDANTINQILIRARHSKEESQDFVILLQFLQSGIAPQCCVVVCSKETPLEEVAGRFRPIDLETFRVGSASNGSLHLRITLDRVEGDMMSIRPESMIYPPDFTVNASTGVENWDLVLESAQLLREKGQNKAKEQELKERAKDNSDRLQKNKEKREAIEDELRKLAAESKVLVEQELLLGEEQKMTKERGGYISEKLIHIQKLLDNLYHAGGCKDGWTPFRCAIENGNAEVVELLSAEVAGTAVANNYALMPLISASRKGDVVAARLLLDAMNVDTNSLDNHGLTPLRWAKNGGHDEVVQLLLDKGADFACRQTLRGHNEPKLSVTFSHDSKLIVSGFNKKTIKIWDAITCECKTTLQGHSGFVYSMAFSHDSKLVVSGSQDKTIKIWDSTTGQCKATLEGHSDLVRSVAFSHDSKLIVSGSQDGTIKIWDAVTEECKQTLRGHDTSVRSVAFSHDSKLIASGSSDDTIKIWDAITCECKNTLQGQSSLICPVAFSHDSKLVASTSASEESDATIKIWDLTTGQCKNTLQGHSSLVSSVAFSHDSKLIVSGSQDKTIKIWDTATYECKQTLRGHGSSVRSVAFSHDSKLIVSGSYDAIKIWDSSMAHDSVSWPSGLEMTLKEYSNEAEIANFFAKTSTTQAACDARARELAGGSVVPVSVQRACSYSVYAGPNLEFVVQFRLKSLSYDAQTTVLAREIYGDLVPKVTFAGQVGDDSDGKEALTTYWMSRIRGITHLDFILAHGYPENSPNNRVYRKTLMADVARELSLLLSALPGRFHPIIQKCIGSVDAILSLPMVLLHRDFGYSNIMHIFWDTFKQEVGGLTSDCIQTIKLARITGLLLTYGFTGRFANQPDPVPIGDDECGRYNVLSLDGFLIHPATRFEDLD
ncbi:vegetative incompatibility het-e-1 [Trichoderma arundinaceum]|uniref:Mitochondrial division protein 1 n=1 Tax=Trichoderma arundinaceum TaxID=490622 RepID=A0A395NWD7_TRIAR|nr:vegetative incompatibility het-e-1 [Trichoderma arundinaceum]